MQQLLDRIYLDFLLLQVVIVGNGAVGKSSMIQRYCKGIFTRNYKKTIGVDFLEKHVTYVGSRG
jgi:Ras-related protein Rab-23